MKDALNVTPGFLPSSFSLGGAVLLFFLSARLLTAADPIEGKWLGQAGSPENRAVFGLEIKADAEKGLAASLYLDQLNCYGTPLPPLKKEGAAQYSEEGMGMKMELAGDKLNGTLAGGKVPFTLSRTEQLPSDPPLPNDLPAGPEPRWSTKLGGAIYSPAAVRDGFAYVGTTNGVLNAVKIADGKVAWSFAAGRPIFGEPLTTDEAVYFACDNGFLFKLARADGKELWRYDLGDSRTARILPDPNVFEYDYRSPRPLLVDDTVFIGSGDGGFHAIKSSNGKRVWRVEAKGKVRANACAIGSDVVFGTIEGAIRRLDRATGKEKWSFDAKAPVTSEPIAIDGKIILGTRGSALYAMNPETGERVWRSGFWGSWVESSAVPFGNLFYIGSSDLRRVSCFDPKDGRVVWRTDVFGFVWDRPLVTDKFVYVGAAGTDPYMIRHRGSLSALDRATGRLVWRRPIPHPPGVLQTGFAAAPVRADDHTFIIGGLDGTLYAFPLT